MNPSSSPYDAAIEELENQIRHYQSILDSLKALRLGPEGAPLMFSASGSRDVESEVRHDTFFAMTIADAAKKYLSMMKATKSTAAIAEALERGGLKHSSKSFPTTLRSVLGPREEFTRVPNGDWGLSEWYPGQGRGKKPKPEKSTKTRSKKAARAKGPKPKLEDQIIEAMGVEPSKDWTSVEVAMVIGAQRTSVQSTMSRMGKDGSKIVKAEKGYRLFRPMISAA